MGIKNVVFDIGNVLLRYAPEEVVRLAFPQELFPEDLTKSIFKSQIWYDLNLGKITEKQAIRQYHRKLSIPVVKLEELMSAVKESLLPLEGSLELLDELYRKEITLYSITDNVKEIIKYLKGKYTFFNVFSGMSISAEIGVLKPAAKIYNHLIENYNLDPQETVFLDDLKANVEGAESIGMKGIHFNNAAQARKELQALGIEI